MEKLSDNPTLPTGTTEENFEAKKDSRINALESQPPRFKKDTKDTKKDDKDKHSGKEVQ